MASLKYFNTSTNQWEVIKTDTINGVIPNNQIWTASQGQKIFTIANGQIADAKLLTVYVDGKVRNDFTMTNNTTFQFFTGLTSGQAVFAEWFEVSVPATIGHHSTHEVNGQDPIDITKLTNYQGQIATPLGTAQTNITDLQNNASALQTDVTNHKNNTSNPHSVTATQVGAYSKTEVDNKLIGKITGDGDNLRIETTSGIFFTNGSSNVASATIAFETAFTSPPIIFPADINGSVSYSDVIYYPFIYGVTTTGFNVKIVSIGDLGVFGDPRNIFMHFIAIGN